MDDTIIDNGNCFLLSRKIVSVSFNDGKKSAERMRMSRISSLGMEIKIFLIQFQLNFLQGNE